LLFTISGKHIDITEAIKKYAEEKTSRLSRYYNSINRVEVTIDGNEGGKTHVEIIARAGRNKTFVVAESGDDSRRCIDSAVHKLERQLRRRKGIERDNKHTQASAELT